MLFNGQMMQLSLHESGNLHLLLNAQTSQVNTLSYAALSELAQVLTLVETQTAPGLIISSAKESFVVGADITEFIPMFSQSNEVLIASLMQTHAIFNRLEDLKIPTVACINGHCLGGGMELVLSCDFRVLSLDAKVGLPEVKLGIFPGFGGTVRLPRLIGADNAFDWICTGKEKRAEQALKDHVADSVVSHEQLLEAGVAMLAAANAGKLDFQAVRKRKTGPLTLNQNESLMSFETAKAYVAQVAGRHYPAPVAAVATIQKHAWMTRAQATQVEAAEFTKMAKTSVARNLIGLFLGDQYVKKVAKKLSAKTSELSRVGVIGAGIMGGGIAYQSASSGLICHMKDINEAGIALGLKEAGQLFAKQVERKKIDLAAMATGLNRIRPCLTYAELAGSEVCVEAVVEHPKIKQAVLAELEQQVPAETVLCSNTSTISIDLLASQLSRPEQFCGMHFFNPVHKMPLVEVIRGAKTSDKTIAKVVTLAKQLGKTPIVVNDCPGFLVNRILFPYFAAFAKLVADGVDFVQIDKVMEKFGWPMGPAQLLDVVGLDTGDHAQKVMAAGFPDRMAIDEQNVIGKMAANNWFGQKNGKGFYQWCKVLKDRLKRFGILFTGDELKQISKAFTFLNLLFSHRLPFCSAMY